MVGQPTIEQIDPVIAAEIEFLLEEALKAIQDRRLDKADRIIEQTLARYREVVPGIETLITSH